MSYDYVTLPGAFITVSKKNFLVHLDLVKMHKYGGVHIAGRAAVAFRKCTTHDSIIRASVRVNRREMFCRRIQENVMRICY